MRSPELATATERTLPWLMSTEVLPVALLTPGRSIATRGGDCTEKPCGTAASGSLSSTRTTSVPPCWMPVTLRILGSAHDDAGSASPNARTSAAPAVQLRMFRYS